MEKFKENLNTYIHAVLGSYSQIFFSDNKWFAGILILSTFLDPFCGFSGFFAVIITILSAKIIGLNPASVRSGLYSFNSLLVGLMVGYNYSFSPEFFFILILISLLTLFFSVWFEIQLSKSGLPFLSLPFMIAVWTVLLSIRSFGAISLNERGIFTLNELWGIGGAGLVNFYEQLNSLEMPLGISIYFKSLGAIFFQSNIIAGFLIAAGLLLFSRIAFTLSLLGFFTGFLFFTFIGGNISDLRYSFIGFNFILSAIAIGGFFTIPSLYSYLLVIAIIPLTGIISSALGNFLNIFQLPVFSLPFNIIVILTLSVLKIRTFFRKPELVLSQQFSPEKNLYRHKNQLERFKNDTYFHIHLPFFGEWKITQGHTGKHTHKGDWQYAWDFAIADDTGKTFRPPGEKVDDFFCYNLPILAPGPGYVITIVDEVDDNQVGKVDISHNWGNTIIIKHNELLYSKISHIKKNSFRVKEGDYVKKGDVLACCGSSGRSPEPHVHFQLQAAPFIGAKTSRYPVSYYITKNTRYAENETEAPFSFHAFDYPCENQVVLRPTPTQLIRESFNFIPGVVLNFETRSSAFSGPQEKEKIKWEVFVDAYNHAYLYCHKTRSCAYFVNNGTLHYFTEFAGDKSSMLYYFYLGAYKILLGYYRQMKITDKLPLEGFHRGPSKIIQDFIAPFRIFLEAGYHSAFNQIDDESNPSFIEIKSSAWVKAGNNIRRKVDFTFTLKGDRIQSFSVDEKGKTMVAEAV